MEEIEHPRGKQINNIANNNLFGIDGLLVAIVIGVAGRRLPNLVL